MENFRSQIVLEERILLPAGLFACCWQDPFLIRILLRTEFTKSNPLQQDQNMKSLEAFIIPTRCNLQSRIQISNPFSPQNGSAIWLSRTPARYMEGALSPLFSLKLFAFMSFFIASSCHYDNKTLRQPVIRNHFILRNQESLPLPLALCIHSFHCFILW